MIFLISSRFQISTKKNSVLKVLVLKKNLVLKKIIFLEFFSQDVEHFLTDANQPANAAPASPQKQPPRGQRRIGGALLWRRIRRQCGSDVTLSGGAGRGLRELGGRRGEFPGGRAQ